MFCLLWNEFSHSKMEKKTQSIESTFRDVLAANCTSYRLLHFYNVLHAK